MTDLSIDFDRLEQLIATRRPETVLSLDAEGLANLVRQYREVEAERDALIWRLEMMGVRE